MPAVSLDLPEAEENPIVPAAPAEQASASSRLRAAWRSVPQIVRVMFCLDVLMGVLYVLSRRGKDVLPRPIVHFLDLNGEMNLPSWYASVQLALVGGLLITFAGWHLNRRRTRAAMAVLLGGIGFLFLSLDEMIELHENFGYWLDKLYHRRETIFQQTGIWMVICAPLFLVGIVSVGLAARRYLRGRGAVVRTFAAGAGVYLAAAAGVEALSNFATPHGAAARALVLLEEGGEMLGATFMLWGVWELLRSHGIRLFVAAAGGGAHGSGSGSGSGSGDANGTDPSLARSGT